MSDRTMMTLSATQKCIVLRTFSRNYCSPHRFIFMGGKLTELEEKGYVIVSDILSFAELSLRQTLGQGDILEIVFTWLSDAGRGEVSGMRETIRVPYKKFRESVTDSRDNGILIKLLSLKDDGRPEIVFQSRKNLNIVAQSKVLRKKFGKLLNNHFLSWRGSRQITLYDDFEPYSFFFQEKTPDGIGMCGGVILHNRENMKKAYYGMHT